MDPMTEFAALGDVERAVLIILQRLDELPPNRKTALSRTNIEQGLQWIQSREFDLRAVGLPDEAARIGRKVGVG